MPRSLKETLVIAATVDELVLFLEKDYHERIRLYLSCAAILISESTLPLQAKIDVGAATFSQLITVFHELTEKAELEEKANATSHS